MRYLRAFIFLLFFAPASCFAVDISGAFNALVNHTNPGLYESESRGYMVGGSVSVNFPVSNIQFINLTTPTLNTGCNGISMIFGGISFVSGDQFITLLKGVMSSALGYAFQLAVRTLCPTCATILSDLQKAAQAANDLAMNQCAFAVGLVNKGINSVPGMTKWMKDRAALADGDINKNGGFLSALDKLGAKTSDFISSIEKEKLNLGSDADKKAFSNGLPLGNEIYKALSGLAQDQQEFLMSLLGVIIKQPKSVDSKAPIMTPKDLVNLIMYGADAGMNKNLKLYQCAGDTTLEKCTSLTTVEIKKSKWYLENQTGAVGGISLAQYGFYGAVYGALEQTLNNIADGTTLSTAQTVDLPDAIYPDHSSLKSAFTTVQIEGILGTSPVPVYRALNLAAIDKVVSDALVRSVSELVAIHYSVAFIDQNLLDTREQGNSKSGTQNVDSKVLKIVRDGITHLKTSLAEQIALVTNYSRMITTWTAQINQIQSQIYSDVVKDNLGQQFAYSSALSGRWL